MEIIRPTWVEIKLSTLKKNLLKIRRKIGKNKKLMFVVKADAYGHGACELSRYVQNNTLCEYLGVSSIDEGIQLRENLINLPIIILGSIYPTKNFHYLIEYNLTPTISSLVLLKELEKFLKKTNKKISVHLKLETGMNRIGASTNTMLKMIDYISKSKNIHLEGIYSHFSSADTDKNYTIWQLKNFNEFLEKIKNLKIIKHIANSFATVYYPQSHLDMVRCGIAAYGCMKGFEEILSLKTKIVFIKQVKKGTSISYSRSYITPKKMKVATIPVGYGDGYIRALSNKAFVKIGSKYAKVLGNITMDMTMIDITGIDAKIGDEVIVFGNGIKNISIQETAKIANTIPYEITTLITKRVKRIYK
ncbi:MAG: alanine racemase [Elusimicrobiales bacterium]|nr:alanine racemase [Elusimicrobiales bacterium]